MDCIAIIPARFASTRFPGKLLAPIAGRPLIQHVVEAAQGVPGIDVVVVATDDERIREAARATSADVVMSSGEFASGTDRVAAAASQYSADVIVNVQGDELLLDPDAVGVALGRFRESAFELGTLRASLTERHDLWDPNVVKVVIDNSERALYFSRAPLPFPRDDWQAARDVALQESPKDPGKTVSWPFPAAAGAQPSSAWVHVGVYLYRPQALRRWATMEPSPLEKVEGLEQLRVIEAGEQMQTYLVNQAIPGVNTPEDLERAVVALAARGSGG